MLGKLLSSPGNLSQIIISDVEERNTPPRISV